METVYSRLSLFETQWSIGDTQCQMDHLVADKVRPFGGNDFSSKKAIEKRAKAERLELKHLLIA